jgi:hypothetical protein
MLSTYSRTTLEREHQTPLQTRGTVLLGLSRILVFSLVRSTPDNGIVQAEAKHRVDLEGISGKLTTATTFPCIQRAGKTKPADRRRHDSDFREREEYVWGFYENGLGFWEESCPSCYPIHFSWPPLVQRITLTERREMHMQKLLPYLQANRHRRIEWWLEQPRTDRSPLANIRPEADWFLLVFDSVCGRGPLRQVTPKKDLRRCTDVG